MYICTQHMYTCTHTHKHTQMCPYARALSHSLTHHLANGLAHTRRRTTHDQLPHRPTRVSAHMRGTPGPNCRAPPGLQAAGGQTLLWPQDSLSHRKSRGLSGCRCKRLRVSSSMRPLMLFRMIGCFVPCNCLLLWSFRSWLLCFLQLFCPRARPTCYMSTVS